MYSEQKNRFDNLENQKNLGGQKNVQDLDPDQKLVEIDQLEARLRDSRRLLQQERDSVSQLNQVMKKVSRGRTDTPHQVQHRAETSFFSKKFISQGQSERFWS